MKRKNTTLHIITAITVLTAIATAYFTHEIKRECEKLAQVEQIHYQMTHYGTLCNIQHQGEKLKRIK